jgi:hypothetical protein
LVVFRAEGGKGEGGGVKGPFIGVGAGKKRQALKWIKEGGMALSSGVIHGWRRKRRLTGGARCR